MIVIWKMFSFVNGLTSTQGIKFVDFHLGSLYFIRAGQFLCVLLYLFLHSLLQH